MDLCCLTSLLSQDSLQQQVGLHSRKFERNPASELSDLRHNICLLPNSYDFCAAVTSRQDYKATTVSSVRNRTSVIIDLGGF